MNIQMLDEAADWDQIEDYAASVEGAIVYFENPRLESADDSIKQSVIEYYQFQEDVPIELISHMKLKYYGIIKFRNADVAFDFVTDYFPRRDELPEEGASDVYWYQCYVVRQDGVVEYDNKALRPGNNR